MDAVKTANNRNPPATISFDGKELANPRRDAGHGYSVVHVTAATDVEFVCIPRPVERSTTDDGGDLSYRVTHRVNSWKSGESPLLVGTTSEGKLPLISDALLPANNAKKRE